MQPRTRSAASPNNRQPIRYPVLSLKLTFRLRLIIFKGTRVPLPEGHSRFIHESRLSGIIFLHKALKNTNYKLKNIEGKKEMH